MSFETALTGLNAASADLGIISNNIANTSTTGFKASRAEFADIYAASNLGTSSTSIGSGVRLASVAQQFTQGSITYTDNNLDLAINGQGFFRLNDNGNTVYSRSGQFRLDRDGYVVNNGNQRLTVFTADSSGNVTGALGDLRLSTGDIAPQVTQTVSLGANLDAAQDAPVVAFNPADSTSFNHSTSTTIYDSLGTAHLATMYYRKTAANTWNTYAYVDGTQVDGPNVLTFNGDGSMAAIDGTAVPPYTITSTPFLPAGGASAMALTLDYADLTQYGSGFSVHSLTQDGFTTGSLSGIDIGDTGIVFARYSNGQSKALGQLALSNFANPQGLRQVGDTSWAETFDSGAALTGAPGSASLGLLQSGALEESNVSLSDQLVHMITVQRNYQANAQVISTADAITQTIINIR